MTGHITEQCRPPAAHHRRDVGRLWVCDCGKVWVFQTNMRGAFGRFPSGQVEPQWWPFLVIPQPEST